MLGYWHSHHKLLSHKTCGLGFWPCLTSVIYNLRGWVTAPTLVSVTSKLEGYATGPLLRCYCRDARQLSLDNYVLPLVLTVRSLHISIVLYTSCVYSAMYNSWEAFVFSTCVIDAITGLQCLSSVCRIKRDFHPQLTTKQNSTWTIQNTNDQIYNLQLKLCLSDGVILSLTATIKGHLHQCVKTRGAPTRIPPMHNIPNCMTEVTWHMLCLSTNGHRSAGLGWLPFI